MTAWLRHHVSVAGCFARMAVQRQMEYPLFLFSWLLMIPIHYFGGAWALKLIVEQFKPLNGWGFPELAFLYGLGLLSHGLMVVFFIQTWHFDYMVTHGGFDRMLLRPMNVFYQFVVQNVNFIGFIDLIPGTVLFVYGSRLVHFDWSAGNAVKLALVVLGGVLIRASFYSIMGSIAFWTNRSGVLVLLGQSMLEQTSLYPLSLYPHMVQFLFTFLVPIGFISFYPAVEFLGQPGAAVLSGSLALWTPAIGAAMFVLAQFVFMLGIRRYESAGS